MSHDELHFSIQCFSFLPLGPIRERWPIFLCIAGSRGWAKGLSGTAPGQKVTEHVLGHQLTQRQQRSFSQKERLAPGEAFMGNSNINKWDFLLRTSCSKFHLVLCEVVSLLLLMSYATSFTVGSPWDTAHAGQEASRQPEMRCFGVFPSDCLWLIWECVCLSNETTDPLVIRDCVPGV